MKVFDHEMPDAQFYYSDLKEATKLWCNEKYEYSLKLNTKLLIIVLFLYIKFYVFFITAFQPKI